MSLLAPSQGTSPPDEASHGSPAPKWLQGPTGKPFQPKLDICSVNPDCNCSVNPDPNPNRTPARPQTGKWGTQLQPQPGPKLPNPTPANPCLGRCAMHVRLTTAQILTPIQTPTQASFNLRPHPEIPKLCSTRTPA